MNPRRLWAVARLDVRQSFRRPMFWIWAGLLTLLIWGMSQGNVTVQSGDTSVGGEKAWITSEFHNAFMAVTVFALIHMLFVAVAAGMAVIHDDELGVGPVLHATRLKASEYVLGKVLAVLIAFAGILVVQVGAGWVFNHFLADAESSEFIGPFVLANYLRPVLLLTAPLLLFVTGVSFWVGERTRRPVLVFLLPVAILGTFIFLTEWNPSWLSTTARSALQWTDPTGYRWLSDEYLDEDRGVAFYNAAQLQMGTGFLVSRIVFASIGLLGLGLSVSHFAKSLRGTRKATRAEQHRAAIAEPEADPAERVRPAPEPLGGLGMRSRRPGFIGGTLAIFRSELRELRAQPGLYLFTPMIVLQAAGGASIALGAFDTPMLWTPGQLASSALGALRMMLCLLMLFYVVESLRREQGTGLAAIAGATPVRTASVLAGKLLANLGAALFVMAVTLAVLAVMLAFQGTVPFDALPFGLVWGVGLVPTLLLWGAFVTALFAITKNRFTTYGLAVALIIWSAYQSVMGDLDWTTNWELRGALLWSDMGPFEFNREALILNRVMALSGTVFFLVFALRVWPRREFDATQTLLRLKPLALLRTSLALLPWAAVPLIAGGMLGDKIDAGFQGDAAENWAKDYWKKNVATWTDRDAPDIASAVIDLTLEPAERRYSSKGTLELINRHDEAIPQVALTGTPEWESVLWRVDGEEVEPEDRAGLYVFDTGGPLEPGESFTVEYEVVGRRPMGITKNGGGNMTFLLEAGIVLTSFEPGFVPSVGYSPGIGVDEDNDYDSKDFLPDFYEGVTASGFGQQEPHDLKLTIHAPEKYRLNAPGTLTSDTVEAGIRTAVWETEHPVTFFNVVAGVWDVRQGEGTELWYHPAHTYNVDEMGLAVDSARKYYAEWFREYPWETLKVSEFPGLAGYAQGFPTNITFSESIGFLNDTDEVIAPAFFVTAHECAHQWWGNLLVPGDGPGGNILSEGMSHYSTMLLTGEIKGPEARMELMRRLESTYNDSRQVDAEKALVWIDGSRPGDTTVTYDKGGWVAWMLHHEIGRENMFAGLQSFVAYYEADRDHPVLQDLVAHLRPFAPDPEAYDAFVEQWFFEVVLPKFTIEDAVREQAEDEPGAWDVRFTLKNAGTGTVQVEVAAARGERWPETGADAWEDGGSGGTNGDPGPAEAPAGTALAAEVGGAFQDERTSVTLGPGESTEVVLRTAFEPERIVVDPDVMQLQAGRQRARHEF